MQSQLPTFLDRGLVSVYSLHLPTACRSAMFCQQSDPNLQCFCTTDLTPQTQKAALYKHVDHCSPAVLKQHTIRTAGLKWTQQQPSENWAILTPRRMTECRSCHAPLHHSGALRCAQPDLGCESPTQVWGGQLQLESSMCCCCLEQDTKILDIT